jgi:hypothetical protein
MFAALVPAAPPSPTNSIAEELAFDDPDEHEDVPDVGPAEEVPDGGYISAEEDWEEYNSDGEGDSTSARAPLNSAQSHSDGEGDSTSARAPLNSAQSPSPERIHYCAGGDELSNPRVDEAALERELAALEQEELAALQEQETALKDILDLKRDTEAQLAAAMALLEAASGSDSDLSDSG